MSNSFGQRYKLNIFRVFEFPQKEAVWRQVLLAVNLKETKKGIREKWPRGCLRRVLQIDQRTWIHLQQLVWLRGSRRSGRRKSASSCFSSGNRRSRVCNVSNGADACVQYSLYFESLSTVSPPKCTPQISLSLSGDSEVENSIVWNTNPRKSTRFDEEQTTRLFGARPRWGKPYLFVISGAGVNLGPSERSRITLLFYSSFEE